MALLPSSIEKAPQKRLLVKIKGELVSPKPIKVQEKPQLENVVVKREAHSWSTNRTFVVLESTTRLAEDIEIKVRGKGGENKGYVDGTSIFVSPSIIETMETQLLGQKETFHGNRAFSSIMGLFSINYPWRASHRLEVVPNKKHVFAAMDATSDSNGRITLIETNRLGFRKIMSYKHEHQILDELKDRSTIWKGMGISSAFLGAVLAGLALTSRR